MISAGTGIEALVPAIIAGVTSIGSMAINASAGSDSGGFDKKSKMGSMTKDPWADIGTAVNKQPQPRINANLPEFNAPDVSTGDLGMPYKLTGMPIKTSPKLNWR